MIYPPQSGPYESITARAQQMVLMGDSRVAQCTVPAGGTSNGTTYTYDSVSWWNWANIALGQRFNYLANTAVGGTTTTQHVSDQLPTVSALAASHVLWFGFVNDIGVSSTPDATVTIAALTTGFDAIRNGGKVLIACTDYRSSGQTASGQISAQHKINQFIRKYAREHANVLLFDVAALMTDPILGTVTHAYMRTEGDGSFVHPNNVGAMLLGQALAQLLDPLTAPLSPLIAGPDDPYNLVATGLFPSAMTGWGNSDGSGGGAPGTISRVARTDSGPGTLLQIVLVAPGTGTGKINEFYSNVSVVSATHGGHVVVPRCYFETGVQGGAMDWSNIDHFRIWATVVGANAASFSTFQGTDTGAVSTTYFPRSGVFQGPPITIPNSGVTRIQFFAEIATTGAVAGGGTVRLGQAEIHDLTACGY